MTRMIHRTANEFGKPRFLITDHGTQFRRQFHAKLGGMGIHHVRGRVRAPYLDGKMERAFRTFRMWWRLVLTGLSQRGIQRKLDDYCHWYNTYRPHSALNGLTPEEAWQDKSLPEPFVFRAKDTDKLRVAIRQLRCRGDAVLPVIQITVRRAA